MAKGKRLMTGQGGRYRYQGTGKPGKRLAAVPRRIHAGLAAVAVGMVALALAGAVELSAAYLMVRGSVDNTFVLGSVTPSVVEETFDPVAGVKKNVSVANNGNMPVYIRALILVSWQDDSGAILSAQPAAGTDYDCVLAGAETGWSLGSDGYYYYTKPVPARASTPVLIQSLTDKNETAGRRLRVDVIAQAVQAEPAQAVSDVFPGASVGAAGVLTPPKPAEEGGEGA